MVSDSYNVSFALTRATFELLKQTRSRFPFVERVYAAGGYSGAKTAARVGSTRC